MEVCASCGDPFDAGRFCTGCGHPIGEDADWRTGTAERPAIRDAGPTMPPPPHPPPLPPPTSPPPSVTPPHPRFPLYADQVGAPAETSDPEPAPTLLTTAPADPLANDRPDRPAAAHADRPRRPWLPWLAVVLVLVLMAVIGGVLLLRGGDPDTTAADPAAGAQDSSSAPTEQPSEKPDDKRGTAPAQPTGPGKPKRSKRKPPGPQDVTSTATVSAPRTAPPNQDVDGDLVRYDATNMLDDRADTAWRMPGDGTGSVIVIGLGEPTEVSQVGLINGYAKRSGSFDWYTSNRRITDVEWVFDDGTTVSQSLLEQQRLQTIDIEPVRTRTVRLRLVTVTAPGRGPAGRDFTPVSELVLVGTRG